MSVLLFDTDVCIDYLRGIEPAVTYVESLADPILLSTISVAELYAGVREGSEREALTSFIAAWEIVPVDEAIAIQGGLFRRDYGKSHQIGLADALIAATAELRNASLVTLNKKHFPMLSTVTIPYTKN